MWIAPVRADPAGVVSRKLLVNSNLGHTAKAQSTQGAAKKNLG
jgi:hypothetical protein